MVVNSYGDYEFAVGGKIVDSYGDYVFAVWKRLLIRMEAVNLYGYSAARLC